MIPLKKMIPVVAVVFFAACTEQKEIEANTLSVPEKPVSQVVDTILDTISNISLKMKYYTLADEGFELTAEAEEDTTRPVRYRNFGVDISVNKGGKTVYSNHIEKDHFAMQINDPAYLSGAVLVKAKFEAYEENEVVIQCWICKPGSDHCYIYDLIIAPNGTETIEEGVVE